LRFLDHQFLCAESGTPGVKKRAELFLRRWVRSRKRLSFFADMTLEERSTTTASRAFAARQEAGRAVDPT